MAGAESHPRHPAAIGGPARPPSADVLATFPPPHARPETQNEPNLALQLPAAGRAAATSDLEDEANSACPAADQVAHPDQTHSPAVDLALHPDQTQSLPAPAAGAPYPPAPLPASDLAILDRLTRHAEETILEAARHAAHHAPAGGRSVEDEIAELRSLARHLSARPAAT